VFASIAEGFGLPLVEGISCGLTAFTSDIPVFREIGENVPGDRLRFFDSASPDALARAIADFEHRLPAARPRESFVWPTWERSTLAFLVKAQALAEGIAAGRETAAPAQRPALIPAERIATES
jgi:glycosyltransferase involved in cell wall biosynthesis